MFARAYRDLLFLGKTPGRGSYPPTAEEIQSAIEFLLYSEWAEGLAEAFRVDLLSYRKAAHRVLTKASAL